MRAGTTAWIADVGGSGVGVAAAALLLGVGAGSEPSPNCPIAVTLGRAQAPEP